MGDVLSLFGEGDALSLFDVDQHAPLKGAPAGSTGATTRDDAAELALVVDLNTWAGRVADVNATLAGEQLEHDQDDDHDAPFCNACGSWHDVGDCDLDPTNTPGNHHPDCDGWRLAHRAPVVQHYASGPGSTTYGATCSEHGCGWSFAEGATTSNRSRCEHDAQAHSRWVECDGRCKDWE